MGSVILWGNATVPYTAMWTWEAERRVPVAKRERWDGHWLQMLCEGVSAPGQGKPLFKVLHADRCREVVRQRVCQMCLAPLPETCVVVNQGQTDLGRPLISDGLPMCDACALAALGACPGMQRQARAGTLRMWRTRRGAWLHAPVVLGQVPQDQGGNEATNELLRRTNTPIFTGPKLVLTEWSVFQIPEHAYG